MTPQDETKVPLRVGVREFRGNLSGFLRQARHGASFLITSRGKVVAELHPPSAAVLPRRQAGALRGKMRMAPDFDTLPADVQAVMEGRES